MTLVDLEMGSPQHTSSGEERWLTARSPLRVSSPPLPADVDARTKAQLRSDTLASLRAAAARDPLLQSWSLSPDQPPP
jgi:hypothetical protein